MRLDARPFPRAAGRGPSTIAGYLGKSDTFDRALAAFAAVYADQNELDFASFRQAIREGRLPSGDDVA